MSVGAATWQDPAMGVSGAQHRTQNFWFWCWIQNSPSLSSSFQRLLFAIFIYHHCCLLANGERTARTTRISACPQNSAKALELHDRWFLNDIRNFCPWARFGGAVFGLCSEESERLLCDMWLFHNNFNYFACFQTIVSAFFNFTLTELWHEHSFLCVSRD